MMLLIQILPCANTTIIRAINLTKVYAHQSFPYTSIVDSYTRMAIQICGELHLTFL